MKYVCFQPLNCELCAYGNIVCDQCQPAYYLSNGECEGRVIKFFNKVSVWQPQLSISELTMLFAQHFSECSIDKCSVCPNDVCNACQAGFTLYNGLCISIPETCQVYQFDGNISIYLLQTLSTYRYMVRASSKKQSKKVNAN